MQRKSALLGVPVCACMFVLPWCLRRTLILCTQAHFFMQGVNIIGNITCAVDFACVVSLGLWAVYALFRLIYTRTIRHLNHIFIGRMQR